MLANSFGKPLRYVVIILMVIVLVMIGMNIFHHKVFPLNEYFDQTATQKEGSDSKENVYFEQSEEDDNDLEEDVDRTTTGPSSNDKLQKTIRKSSPSEDHIKTTDIPTTIPTSMRTTESTTTTITPPPTKEFLQDKIAKAKLIRNAILVSGDDGKYESMKKMSYIKTEDMPKSYIQPKIGPYINLLEETPPPFLKNYKNPCWREEITKGNPYKGNFFTTKPLTAIRLPPPELYDKRIAEGVNWKLRCLPYFYQIGFVKSGTSHVYDAIRFHPMLPFIKKEIHWWTRYRNYKTAYLIDEAVPIKHYIDLFDTSAMQIDNITEKIGSTEDFHPAFFGDASTLTATEQWGWYTHPENKGRTKGKDPPRFTNADYIHHITPNARIIVTMRDPASRLYSQFTMHHGSGPEGFHKQVLMATTEMNECGRKYGVAACVSRNDDRKLYKFTLKDSMYYEFVKQWLKVFPKEHFHFVKLEEFSKHNIIEANKLFKFLGVSQIADQTIPAYQRRKIYSEDKKCTNCTRPMLEKTRKYLNKWFKPYNQKLADLLQDDKWLFQ